MGPQVRFQGEKLDALLRVLSNRKERILWIWYGGKLPATSENVKIIEQITAKDILAHSSVKLLISNCDKDSINEAKYHGVPILGMPISGDEPINLQLITDEEWAIPFSYAFLNEQNFADALNEILENSKYRQVAVATSAIYKDRPMDPLDTAVYWVEYVLRHNGARHMQSQAVHLNWFQYYGLDIIGLVWAVFYVSYRLLKCLVKKACSKCCVTKTKAKKD